MKELVDQLNIQLEGLSAQEVIAFIYSQYKGETAFASSMGLEDQVLTHMITNQKQDAFIFTLDTGRVFPETYDLIQKTESRYEMKIHIYFPNTERVEEMLLQKGVNLFYESIENRKLCCGIRKIEPLQRALVNRDAWIVGLRREQSITRQDMRVVEWDANNELIKFNPLIDWTEDRLWDYVKKNNVPYNALHDKGFPSIGCQPCTRAIAADEDVRAGRWWWENPEQKECGLHKK
ncbi:MAG: phosphoadenylyl-sulfate reductase [Bacteroidales bacterium]|nr:phosphoadenylyl-sulfate reductase [Bacteroidales bacterium]